MSKRLRSNSELAISQTSEIGNAFLRLGGGFLASKRNSILLRSESGIPLQKYPALSSAVIILLFASHPSMVVCLRIYCFHLAMVLICLCCHLLQRAINSGRVKDV